MRVPIFLFIILLHGHVKICAQTTSIGSPAISNYSRSDYQAGTQNWMIKQDDRGLMHFGDNKGLLQFDGRDWQVFPLPNKTIVRSLHLIRMENYIWEARMNLVIWKQLPMESILLIH